MKTSSRVMTKVEQPPDWMVSKERERWTDETLAEAARLRQAGLSWPLIGYTLHIKSTGYLSRRCREAGLV